MTDLAASLRFYVDALGFVIEYERPETRFAALSVGDSQLMLEEVVQPRAANDQEFESGSWRVADLDFPFGRGLSFEVTVPDVDSVHEHVKEHGYEIKLGLHNRKYRVGDDFVELRQFLVMDPDGYLVRLAQRIELERR